MSKKLDARKVNAILSPDVWKLKEVSMKVSKQSEKDCILIHMIRLAEPYLFMPFLYNPKNDKITFQESFLEPSLIWVGIGIFGEFKRGLRHKYIYNAFNASGVEKMHYKIFKKQLTRFLKEYSVLHVKPFFVYMQEFDRKIKGHSGIDHLSGLLEGKQVFLDRKISKMGKTGGGNQ